MPPRVYFHLKKLPHKQRSFGQQEEPFPRSANGPALPDARDCMKTDRLKAQTENFFVRIWFNFRILQRKTGKSKRKGATVFGLSRLF